MLDVQTTEAFDEWLDALDRSAQRRIAATLRKLSFGLWGDVKAVGEGVSELREHFGPGYRWRINSRKATPWLSNSSPSTPPSTSTATRPLPNT